MSDNLPPVYLTEQEQQELARHRFSDATKVSYNNSLSRFIGYVALRYPEHIAEPLMSELQAHVEEIQVEMASQSDLEDIDFYYTKAVDSKRSLKQTIKSFLKQVSRGPPVVLEEMHPHLFIKWIDKLRKQGSATMPLGKSSYGSHRAAFLYMFKLHRHRLPEDFEYLLETNYEALVKKNAKLVSTANTNLNSGKDDLDYQAYRLLLGKCWQDGTTTSVFTHTFSALCWNLMCRSVNCVKLCYNHITWHGDALRAYFGHTKTDQTADEASFPRHIYANPLDPVVCPILSLATYFACFPCTEEDKHIFMGRNQYSRFSGRLLQAVEQLKERHSEFSGLDIGTHSFRKGANTYCSSGSTSGPSSKAILIRGGWSQGKIQDNYSRYSEAGDMCVGRYLSGLPSHKADFAMLPPHFATSLDCALLQASIKIAFPGLKDNHRLLGEFLLASLAYHSNYLIENLPANHPLLQTAIFREQDRLSLLQAHVIVKKFNSERLVATGVPPFSAILSEMASVKEKLTTLDNSVKTNVQSTVNGIVSVLEERCVEFNHVTYDGMRANMEQIIDARIGSRLDRMEQQQTEAVSTQPIQEVHVHEGRLLQLPVGYKIPSISVMQVIHLYYHGDKRKHIPPLLQV